MAGLTTRTITTRRGLAVDVLEGGSGAPVVFQHGVTGLLPEEPMLAALAEHFTVYAPTFPGFAEHEGEEALEDMLDFTLHGLDVLDALGLERTALVGHSFGGMVAAEMASLQNTRFDRVALLAPYGLWVDEAPIADVFATLPFELASMLFADAEAGQKVLLGGQDFSDNEALTAFMVANARRMGTAGKVLFPVPNRRLSKRLPRIEAETLIVWGREDNLIPAIYAGHWEKAIDRASVVEIADAGHVLTAERPAEVAEALVKFLG